jgi:hypothetical protein
MPKLARLDAPGVITLKKTTIGLEKFSYLIMPVPHSRLTVAQKQEVNL